MAFLTDEKLVIVGAGGISAGAFCSCKIRISSNIKVFVGTRAAHQ